MQRRQRNISPSAGTRPRASELFALVLLFLLVAPLLGRGQEEEATTTPAVAPSPASPSFVLAAEPTLVHEGDLVEASVRPDNFAATSTVFRWFRNGTEIASASGAGKASYRFIVNSEEIGLISIGVSVDPGPDFSPAQQTVSVIALPTLPSAARFELEASSSSPEPGETVTVSATTFSFDKLSAAYSWFVNGAHQKEASGKGRWRLVLAPIKENQEFVVRVDATLESGESESRTITVAATRSPLYWWTDARVPHWYRGKALPSIGSDVSVLAMPGLRRQENADFQWRFNGLALPASSGIGKSVFKFTLSYPVAEQVAVTVRDSAQTFSKTLSLSLAPFEPLVNIYELRPLSGIATAPRIVQFAAPGGTSYRFQAVPFFVPVSNPLYQWRVDGNDVPVPAQDPDVIRIEAAGAAQGLAEIKIPYGAGQAVFGSFEYDFR